jgi:hypothetical protein
LEVLQPGCLYGNQDLFGEVKRIQKRAALEFLHYVIKKPGTFNAPCRSGFISFVLPGILSDKSFSGLISAQICIIENYLENINSMPISNGAFYEKTFRFPVGKQRFMA